MSNYNRIILKERVRIEAGIYAKKSFGEIVEELGRSTSSITREVKQNRIMVKSPYACGTDCVYPPNCKKTGLCGDEYCTKRCWTCTEHDCTQYCNRCVTHTCKKTEKAPFVCDSCSEKNKKACKYNKYYYIAEKADAKAKKVRSESREGIRLTPQELKTLDEVLSPLVRQGQPLSHICNTHSEEIKVSERSIYNYIEAGELSICNLDLRRKVKYRKRRKKQTEIKCNKFNYRQGRTYEDFQKYMKEHPLIYQ